VLGYVGFNEEAEQFLCAALVRPGNATAAVGAVGLLKRLVRMIRSYFPGVTIRVRLDGGFAHPAALDFLDAQPKLEYVMRYSSLNPTPFSKRDSLGCEAKSLLSAGSRSNNTL
jgi:Transposase DDE domain group 1